MRLSEFCVLVGRSPDTVKRWEAQGLIRPVRDPNGHRVYGDAEVAISRELRTLSLVAQKSSRSLASLLTTLPEQLPLLAGPHR